MIKDKTIPTKATGAVLATIVLMLIIGGAAFALIVCLLSASKKAESQPEKAENPNDDSQPTPPTQTPDKMFPQLIFPQPPVKIDSVVLNTDTTPVEKINPKRPVTREHLTKIFQNGIRALSRAQAVEELKKLGFGKTAAYKALAESGRFAASLYFKPDGMIGWKSGIV